MPLADYTQFQLIRYKFKYGYMVRPSDSESACNKVTNGTPNINRNSLLGYKYYYNITLTNRDVFTADLYKI